jgi:hypothetical protein
MLPFYQIRPFYTGTIYFLYKLGVDIAFATHIISGISVAIALFLIYLLSIKFLKNLFAYAIPFLVLAFGIPDLAKVSTPDGMAFFAVVLISYLYLKRRFLILISILPILLCIRTDLILFTIPLLCFILLQSKKLRNKTVISIACSVCLYIAIGAYWSNSGWATIFYFTLVEISTHPISVPSSLTTHHYVAVLIRGINTLINNHKFLLYVSVFICSFAIILKRSKQKSLLFVLNYPPAILSIVCFIFIISHFILFPVAWDRFFLGTYLVGFFSWLIMVAEYVDAPSSSNVRCEIRVWKTRFNLTRSA